MYKINMGMVSGLLGILLSIGAICGVYVALDRRVTVVETTVKDKAETNNIKFQQLDEVLKDNTSVIKEVQMTMVKLNTTLDLILAKRIEVSGTSEITGVTSD